MQPVPTMLLAAALAALGPALSQAQSTFILRRGADTISLERFSRTARQLTAEMLIKQQGVRLQYRIALGTDGLPTAVENNFSMATDSTGATPRQSARLAFTPDSVIATITSPAGDTVVQRLGSKAGAFPHINPSFAVWEPALARARQTGAGTVPMFAIAGGQVFEATVAWVGNDSVVITAPGGDVRLAVGPEGKILGGTIPVQGLTIDRSETLAPAALRLAKPDYSAPPGAPYTAEDVTVPTTMGHTLAGTLTLPAGAGRARPAPAVITITGSGGQDRDEAIAMFKGYRPFRELADALARRGIAVLRMDDRGVGSSGGNASIATSADFAQDIRAGLAYLRTRPEIDAARLALMGHSEGGIIAPMVAVDEPELDALVLLAGTSRTGRRILEFQFSNGIRNDPAYAGPRLDSALATVSARVDSAEANPWMKFFINYDPLTAAHRVKVPVLILNGETDQQVTPDQVQELVDAFKAAGNRDVTSHVFPDLNHLFVRDPDGFPGRYTELKDFTLDPAMVTMVVDWLAKRLRPGVL